MSKKFFILCLAFAVTCCIGLSTFTQAEEVKSNLVQSKGTITEIAEDGSYVIVDEGDKTTKFLTTKEFVEEIYLEVGDSVSVSGSQTEEGLNLVECKYEYSTSGDEEDIDSPEYNLNSESSNE